MGRKTTAAFDAKAFLTKAGTGRSVSTYQKKQVVFAQGDPADAVAIRTSWPARHPSPKKSPRPSMATTADFPCSETTVSLICPLSR